MMAGRANWQERRIDPMKRHSTKANTMSRHTKGNEAAKPRRCSNSVVIQITTTQNLVAVLDQVVLTGFFGTSRAAAAERLLAEAIRDLLKEGTIQKRKKAFEAQ
jgi:hypothetical protein